MQRENDFERKMAAVLVPSTQYFKLVHTSFNTTHFHSDCGAPPILDDNTGNPQYTRTTFASTATYECRAYSSMVGVGNGVITCTESGWSPWPVDFSCEKGIYIYK